MTEKVQKIDPVAQMWEARKNELEKHQNSVDAHNANPLRNGDLFVHRHGHLIRMTYIPFYRPTERDTDGS